MNADQIRSWLGLGPGPWPPDCYTLLDLPAGHADPADVEPRVLQQMDRLRMHQLLHPELVTEGMNRLAQALITLTDPSAKAQYDRELGIHPEPQIEIIDATLMKEEELPEAEELVEAAPTEATQEIVLPAEVLLPYEVLSEPRSREQKVAPAPEPRSAVRPWPTPPSSRRWIYRRIAFLRRSRRAWLMLRPVFLDPNDPLDRPGRVLLLLEAATAIRPHLPDLAGVVGGPDEPGALIATVIRQPLLLDTIRRLLPDQRRRLAADWWQGLQELEREAERLRRFAREKRAEAEGEHQPPRILRWLRDFPELLLVAFAVFILLLSAIRSVLSRSP